MVNRLVALSIAAFFGSVNGFAPPLTSTTKNSNCIFPFEKCTSTTTQLSESTGWDSFYQQPLRMPGAEERRKFRRTVYTHDDWVKHRSQDRFTYYLAAIFKSGVYKHIGREVAAVTLMAAFIVVYNGLVGGYTDLDGVVQPALINNSLFGKLTLPLNAFTVTSPSLGLLLGKYFDTIQVRAFHNFRRFVSCLINSSVPTFCYDLQFSELTHLTNAGTKHVKIGE